MKKKKKIWVLIGCSTKDEKYLLYQKEIKVTPNFFLIKTKQILILTTVAVSKNFTKIITEKGEFYLNMSLTQSVKYINIDFIQINKSCFVRLRKIEKRLGFKYIFVKGLTKPIKAGKSFMQTLKEKLS